MRSRGISMGKGFIDALEACDSYKDDIENDSALEDGRTMVLSTHLSSRELTLTFVVWGKSCGGKNLATRREEFRTLLLSRKLTITTSYSDRRYRLVYTGKSTSFSHGVNACQFVVKFVEPDPTDRGIAPKNDLFEY